MLVIHSEVIDKLTRTSMDPACLASWLVSCTPYDASVALLIARFHGGWCGGAKERAYVPDCDRETVVCAQCYTPACLRHRVVCEYCHVVRCERCSTCVEVFVPADYRYPVRCNWPDRYGHGSGPDATCTKCNAHYARVCRAHLAPCGEPHAHTVPLDPRDQCATCGLLACKATRQQRGGAVYCSAHAAMCRCSPFRRPGDMWEKNGMLMCIRCACAYGVL